MKIFMQQRARKQGVYSRGIEGNIDRKFHVTEGKKVGCIRSGCFLNLIDQKMNEAEVYFSDSSINKTFAK